MDVCELILRIMTANLVVVVIALVWSIKNKNRMAAICFLLLFIGEAVHSIISALVSGLTSPGFLPPYAVAGVFVIVIIAATVIGVIVNLFKISKYRTMKFSWATIFCAVALLVPWVVIGILKVNIDSPLRGADLVMISKSHTFLTETGRINTIVADDTCTVVNEFIAIPATEWRRASTSRWNINSWDPYFSSDSNANLSETQKSDMEAILKQEIGDADPDDYLGSIESIDGTDYYITDIEEKNEDGSRGISLISYLYKNRQRICEDGPSDEYYYRK